MRIFRSLRSRSNFGGSTNRRQLLASTWCAHLQIAGAAVCSAARQVGEAALAERHHIRLAYWASFADFLKARNSTFRIKRANKDHWFEFPIGRGGFVISATISTDKQRIGVELYIDNDPLKRAIKALAAQKDAIVGEFGSNSVAGFRERRRAELRSFDVIRIPQMRQPETSSTLGCCLTRVEQFPAVCGAKYLRCLSRLGHFESV